MDLLRNWSVYLSPCFEHSAWGKFLKIDSTQPKNRFFSSLKLPWEPILASFSKKMLETRFFVSLGPSRRTKIKLETWYFLGSVIQMDLKPIIFWVGGSIVAFRVVLSGHSLLQKCLPGYRRSTYSGAKTTGAKTWKLFSCVLRFQRCQKTLFLRQPWMSWSRDVFNFVQSRGRRARGRLLWACLTRKNDPECTNRAQNSIICGYRAMSTKRQISTTSAYNS